MSTSTQPQISGGLLLLGLLLVAGCGSTTAASEPVSPSEGLDTLPRGAPTAIQPGAPGSASRAVDASDPLLRAPHPHTEADVRFMQNMIHHHMQALEMSRFVPDRTGNRSIRLLADRIDRSQMDEIRLMQRWLAEREEEVPGPPLHGEHEGPVEHDADARHDAHGPHHAGERGDPPLMAGMLTPEQLQRLAEARGEEFDRLFLEFMIFHHDGAIQMVEELFASPGSGQGSEIFQFASHVDADQRIEIGRMERMLQQMQARR